MATIKELTERHNVKVTTPADKDRVEVHARMGSVLALLSESADATWENERNHGSSEDHRENKGKMHGTSYKKLTEGLTTGDFDLTPYQKRMEELQRAGFGERIKDLFGTRVNKRTRKRDDADGEFNYDRRFELDPYDRMRRTEHIERRITLNFEACFPGSVSTSTMQNTGTIVWACIRVLEDLGFMVAVNYVKNNQNMRAYDSPDGPQHWYAATEIKASSEYTHPGTLAAAFDPAFYRRINWMLMGVGMDVAGLLINTDLGRPECSDTPCKYVGNSTIVMTSNIDTLKTELIEDKLIEALRQHIEKGGVDDSKMAGFHQVAA